MKTLAFTLLLLAITISTFGQTFKLQGGTSVTKMAWKDKLNNTTYKWFDEEITGYSFLIGADYMEKKFFNLSSNIGFVEKGGKDLIQAIIFDESGNELFKEVTVNTSLDYFTVNTTIDLKYDINNYGTPFISIGPRFDYLVKYYDNFDGIAENNHLKKYNVGLIAGAGYRYNISNFQLGVRVDYYLNFMNIADWSWSDEGINFSSNINDQTYTINIILGYKLK